MSKWIEKNIEPIQSGVITRAELAEIKSLSFTKLYEFNDAVWKTILPSLSLIEFNLSEGSAYNSRYTIHSGSLSYRFIGKKNSTYKISIVSKERESLNLEFDNFSIDSKGVGIDTSAVKNTSILFNGVCKLNGANANVGGNGSTALYANNLKITLSQDSVVTITGGNGGSQSSSTGTRAGGIGISTLGDLEIVANSSSYITTLKVYGGNGGNGYDYGNSGGAGNVGIYANSLSISGKLSCSIVGGNGGDGKLGYDGNDGNDGKKGNNESEGEDSTYGYDGRPGGDGTDGQDGGDGGKGASAIITTLTPSIHHTVLLSATSGNGGDGSDGGKGGNGGKGGDGGDDDRWSPIWIGDMSGGAGGKGGAGGDGGDCGKGGSSSDPIVVNGTGTSLSLTNVTEIHGISGTDGANGADGTDGADGSKGDAGVGG